jgi:hypothetical protein
VHACSFGKVFCKQWMVVGIVEFMRTKENAIRNIPCLVEKILKGFD